MILYALILIVRVIRKTDLLAVDLAITVIHFLTFAVYAFSIVALTIAYTSSAGSSEVFENLAYFSAVVYGAVELFLLANFIKL